MTTTRRTPSRGTIYSVHPSVAMVQRWVEDLPARTGRTLEQWIELVMQEGPKDSAARREWLRTEHGHGANAAWWIVDKAEGKRWDGDPEAYLEAAAVYIEEMYAGARAALRPIHDALIDLGRSLGPDVKVCPCQTIVPLYRHHVFAEIKPATRTRIDFGLALKGSPGIGVPGKASLPKRLIDTGGLAKKNRITHRFEITSLQEIDAEVKKWLTTAYGLDAERVNPGRSQRLGTRPGMNGP
jgi:hypothetical protein